MKIEKIEPGNYYHIYNRGINGTDLFFEKENYQYFLRLYQKYVSPVADTFAYCLMKNHFHFLVYFKEKAEIVTKENSSAEKEVLKDPSRQLSHLFNAYAQAVNKRYGRTGGLFERPFERKRIDSEDYLKKVIFYIHYNPVRHNFVEKIDNYSWSSYPVIVSMTSTFVQSEHVIKWFGDLQNFVEYHKREVY